MAENRPKRVKRGLFWGERVLFGGALHPCATLASCLSNSDQYCVCFVLGGCTAPLCPLASCLPPAPQPLAYDPCLQPLLRLYLGATAPLALPSFGHSLGHSSGHFSCPPTALLQPSPTLLRPLLRPHLRPMTGGRQKNSGPPPAVAGGSLYILQCVQPPVKE